MFQLILYNELETPECDLPEKYHADELIAATCKTHRDGEGRMTFLTAAIVSCKETGKPWNTKTFCLFFCDCGPAGKMEPLPLEENLLLLSARKAALVFPGLGRVV